MTRRRSEQRCGINDNDDDDDDDDHEDDVLSVTSCTSSAEASSDIGNCTREKKTQPNTLLTSTLMKLPLLVLRDGLLVDPNVARDDESDKEEMSDDVGDHDRVAGVSAEGVGHAELFEGHGDDDADGLEKKAVGDERGRDAKGSGTSWMCPGIRPDGSGTCASPGSDPRCNHSLYYGVEASSPSTTTTATTMPFRPDRPSPNEVRDRIGPNVDGGLVYHALLLPDNYDKVSGILPKGYVDRTTGAIKPRRKNPFPVKSSDFFPSLVKVGRPAIETEAVAGYDELWDREGMRGKGASEHDNGKMMAKDAPAEVRWVFVGVLNGWPGLTCLELISIEEESKKLMTRKKNWTVLWKVDRDGPNGIDPSSHCAAATATKGKRGGYMWSSTTQARRLRATLRAPSWSARGWSASSPGFLFWVTGPTVDEPRAIPRVAYGTDVHAVFKCPEDEDPMCDRVTMVVHRYATGGKEETTIEKLIYHSLVLLEWDHRRYCTVVEIGWLNGIGGYAGKANWFEDKDSADPTLYEALPPEMILPWRNTMSEIRCYDVPFASLEQFKPYIEKHKGRNKRFIDPRYPFSHNVRLTYRSRRNIATYLLNYIRRDRTYSEMKRNCQTFAADFCGFLAGKKDVQPFHPVNQLQYVNQKHKFLYESGKYKDGR